MFSMKRPSRGLRESATTTRYWGAFFMPMRIRRILTAMVWECSCLGWPALPVGLPSPCRAGGVRDRRSLPVQAHLAQALGGHAGELLHHAARLVELLEDGVDLLGGGARAAGDAGPAR